MKEQLDARKLEIASEFKDLKQFIPELVDALVNQSGDESDAQDVVDDCITTLESTVEEIISLAEGAIENDDEDFKLFVKRCTEVYNYGNQAQKDELLNRITDCNVVADLPNNPIGVI